MHRPEKIISNFNYSFYPTDASVPVIVESSSSSSSKSLPPPKKPPVAKSKILHEILYPMKPQYDSGSTTEDATEQAGGICPRNEWVSLTPLDMVHNIVSLAEKSPEFSAGLRGSIRNFLTSQVREARGDKKRKSVYAEDENFGKFDEVYADLVESYGKPEQTDSGPRVKATTTSNISTLSTIGALERRTLEQAWRLTTAQDLTPSKEKNDAFLNCMQSWIKHNFASPFPDELMLTRLANYMILQLRCITVNKNEAEILEGNSPSDSRRNLMKITTDKISNWLVNRRTRRWRPAIQRAFDRRRPAALLLEDSLRIYEQKKLRPLIGWDCDALFSFNPKYLQPLKSWKKKVRAGQGKKNKKQSESTFHVLSNDIRPPPLEISPVCSQTNDMIEADGIYSSSVVEI